MQKIEVGKVGIKEKDGYLYFVDKKGEIPLVEMNSGEKKAAKKKKKKVAKKKIAQKKRK